MLPENIEMKIDVYYSTPIEPDRTVKFNFNQKSLIRKNTINRSESITNKGIFELKFVFLNELKKSFKENSKTLLIGQIDLKNEDFERNVASLNSTIVLYLQSALDFFCQQGHRKIRLGSISQKGRRVIF